MANSSSPSISDLLPPSLDLPPHLSAHKYFFVCTLTVAAWDTLVLSPRTWRLYKSRGWPLLKVLYHFIRIFLVIEFVAVGVAFFDTGFTPSMCDNFYLFEPICTAILLAICSVIHCIRIHAIYDQDRRVLAVMGSLTAVQIVVTAICCGFYRSVPLEPTQGCIAGPKHTWVGIYWVAPTLVYTASLGLALLRSAKSVQGKTTNYWYLMLRDNLNLYAATWAVNMANVLFWFIIRPTGPEDSIRTMLSSLAAALTTTMALRIVLGVRGPLAGGGTFSGSWGTSQTATTTSAQARPGPQAASRRSAGPRTYTVDVPTSPNNKDAAPGPAKEGVYTIAPESDVALGAPVKVNVNSHTEVAYDSSDYRS